MVKVFSGIRPSGKLHLGNYLGAIKNWIELQDEADQAIFAVVDYHGITTPFDPKTYHQQVLDTALDYLAAGIDPDKALLIRQSKVPQHTELAWLFNTITPVSWLDRLPTYKEQLEKSSKYNHMGLLDYPVLMAADILIYKSNLVPVGEDQMPHIDLASEVAKKFNSMFGETFEPIKPHVTVGGKIMSLQDPTKKMSKTGDEGIALSDSPDEIRAKLKKAVTDSGKEVRYTGNEPWLLNLFNIMSILGGKRSIKETSDDYQGMSYSEFKAKVADFIIDRLKPFQAKRKEFEDNPKMVLGILEKSEEEARALAGKTLNEVKEKMGLL